MSTQNRNHCFYIVASTAFALFSVLIALPSNGDDADQLIDQRKQLDSTLWKPEVEAQKHEQVFVRLWDRIRAAKQKLGTLSIVPFDQFKLPTLGEITTLEWGITQRSSSSEIQTFTQEQFDEAIAKLKDDGYELEHAEFHHAQFVPATKNQLATSIVSTTLNVNNTRRPHRIAVKAKLHITWATPNDNESGGPRVKTVEARDVVVHECHEKPAFREIVTIATSQKYPRIMPIICRDLDGDGRNDIIAAGLNRVLMNQGGKAGVGEKDGFELRRFNSNEFDIFDAAILEDFTGDGHADFVCVGRDRKLTLFAGDAKGQFNQPAKRCAPSDVTFEFPKAFTAGDIDGDGDLDLFIGQYKFPYSGGQMPTPFYDANDGHPSYLLLNDGRGQFVDATQGDLLNKRNRRMYGASFIDHDNDGDLDLITTNDFCGVDVYANNGRGLFTDVTTKAVDQKHLFGMAHTFGDYNHDGRLDFFAIGMSSTTARRLEQLNLGPKGFEEITKMRPAMGYGNRLYLGDGAGVFKQSSFNHFLNRTGWSWGTTSFDFDLDGDTDIFVANGHTSGQSCKDYCTTYWRHDLYTGSSKENKAVNQLFGDVLADLNANRISWNGFEHNKLLMNRVGGEGSQFVDIAYLLGMAHEYDSRSVIGDDFDRDGRPDLIVTEYRPLPNGAKRYFLHVYRNEMNVNNRHWIGINLAEKGKARAMGATVTVTTKNDQQRKWIVTGDSFSCHHAPVAHFGLGALNEVTAIEVKWSDQSVTRLNRPAIDQYHTATPNAK